jgi:hypothetical protein
MAAIWAWVKGLFTTKQVGVLLAIFAKKAAEPLIAQITNKENQRVAYEFVKSLHGRKDLTCKEKAEVFNLKMLDWAQRAGKILADSAVNCLRELAVNALKAELSKPAAK